MKSVLISIQPHWCELIASGEKTLEVRKTRPTLETPFKCYIYCTKNDDMFWVLNPISRREYGISAVCANLDDANDSILGNGKVIGEFICNGIETIECRSEDYNFWLDASCMSIDDFIRYCKGKDLYGWHISDLVIYDKPKDLSEFYKQGTLSNDEFLYQMYDGSGEPSHNSYASYLFVMAIRIPPQSWCYVEEV